MARKVKSKRRAPNDFGRRDLMIALALALVTLALYAQVRGHQFISLDDDQYISDNPIVARGLTLSGIAWAFTTFHAANWHPLTWLSHMLDCQLFGLNAGAHLLVNALIHVANTCLLFWFLRCATGARWPSALVAALFALHPLHVESVAWAAERKDTLAAFFGLAALLAYARYTEKKSWPRYALVALCLALGLMAKPMLVTWPFVFLLLDYWPLRRLMWDPEQGSHRFARDVWPLVREKLALCSVVVASMVVTFVAQSRGGAVRALADAPLALRVSNSIVSYAKYFLATFWPADLAVYYPFPVGGIPAWQIIGALLLLVALTALALSQARARPWLLVGWLWFLGTLVPVIGLVQVGGQALADRYHYLPSIGLFVALVFGFAELVAHLRLGRVPIAIASAVMLLACAACTYAQVGRWRDSITLFTHTLAVTPDNLAIEYNLGHVLGQERKYDEALAHFAKALRITPDFFDALINTGITFIEMGRAAEATPYLERALRVEPGSSKAHTQLALAFAQENQKAEALREFRRALELAPREADAHGNLGLMLARQGEMTEALQHLHEAVRLNPSSAEAHNNLGLILLARGDARASVPHFSEALRLKPQLTVARDNLHRAQVQLDAGR
ncbi:MAG: tetratricopeptide repeat protein [Chthoniobacterales bacterium]